MNINLDWTNEQKSIFAWAENLVKNKHGMAKALPGCTKTSTSIEVLRRLKTNSLYTVFGKANQLEAAGKVNNPLVTVSTIHSFSFSLLKKVWPGVRGDYSAEWNRVKRLYPDAPKQVQLQLVQLVGKLKNHFINPTAKNALDLCLKCGIDGGNYTVAYPTTKLAEMGMELIKLSAEYPKDKLISFDDMIWLPAHLNAIKKTHDFILIDEAQDTNEPQFAILTGACNGNLLIVGDDNQAIYGFRGAMPGAMTKFQKQLNTDEFKLTVNFRCGKAIIKFANTLMPELKAGPNASEGAVEVINEDKAFNQLKVRDAVLSRTNAPLMPFCLKLLRNKVPAYIEGKDVGRSLQQIVDSLEADTVNQFFDKLQVWQDNKIARATGWFAAQAIENAQDQAATLRTLAESCLTVPEIGQKIESLFLDADKVKVPSVVLSTVHKAKGREWDNVSLINESFKRKGNSPEETIEENNIYKVAITRPRHRLSLVNSK